MEPNFPHDSLSRTNPRSVATQALLAPQIPGTTDRPAVLREAPVITAERLRAFAAHLDIAFPTESAALHAGMVHPYFKGPAINYLTNKPLKDPTLFVIGMSCTAAALAAARACFPLVAAGVISKETAIDTIKRSWTYNSAKAFETSRNKCAAELLTDLTRGMPEGTPAAQELALMVVACLQKYRATDGDNPVGDVIRYLDGIRKAAIDWLMDDSVTTRNTPFDDTLAKSWFDTSGFCAQKGQQEWTQTFCTSFDNATQAIGSTLAASPLTVPFANAYTRKAYEDVAATLEKQGHVVSPELRNILATARDATGHSSLARFVRLFLEVRPLDEKELGLVVQHLVADMVATDAKTGDTRIVTPLQKMDLGGFRGDLVDQGIAGYRWMLREGLAACVKQGEIEIKTIPDYNNPGPGTIAAASYFAIQNTVGNLCAARYWDTLQRISNGNHLTIDSEAAVLVARYLNEPSVDDSEIIEKLL